METEFPTQEGRWWKLSFHHGRRGKAVSGNLVSKPISRMLSGIERSLRGPKVSEFGIVACDIQARPTVSQGLARSRSEPAHRQKVCRTGACIGDRIALNVRKFGIVETWFPRPQSMETKFPLEA